MSVEVFLFARQACLDMVTKIFGYKMNHRVRQRCRLIRVVGGAQLGLMAVGIHDGKRTCLENIEGVT